MSESKPRKYCCSDKAPLEAINCGTLDLVVNLMGFITTAVFTYFYTSKSDSLQVSTQVFGTVKRFVLLKASTQISILVWLFAITLLKICHTTLLLCGTVWQNSFLLKLWLLSVPISLGSSATSFFLAFYSSDKLLCGFLALFYLLFLVYTFWIVTEYAVELRTICTSESHAQLQLQQSPTIEENLEQP